MSEVPGMIAALADERYDEAEQMALRELMERHPVSVVLEAGRYAGFLHRHPEMTLQQFAAAMQLELPDDDDPEPPGPPPLETVGGNVVGGWVLDALDLALEGHLTGDDPEGSTEIREILERLDGQQVYGSSRTMSGTIIEVAAGVIDLLIRRMGHGPGELAYVQAAKEMRDRMDEAASS